MRNHVSLIPTHFYFVAWPKLCPSPRISRTSTAHLDRKPPSWRPSSLSRASALSRSVAGAIQRNLQLSRCCELPQLLESILGRRTQLLTSALSRNNRTSSSTPKQPPSRHARDEEVDDGTRTLVWVSARPRTRLTDITSTRSALSQ
jgi:hypothetical protein